ncbi:MAG: metallophosphoesterase family protein [Gammaproteobacteria bacterium]|nr:metallophosphoesterase family protein [Gammaproteobacteria bacterium]MDH5630322.1 metallophosphoesterase family protein [Gammaproteobacteria bacterium]
MNDTSDLYDEIIIIGTIGGSIDVEIDDIGQALQKTPKLMQHGSEFTGRPSTIILEDQGWLYKLKYDISLNARNAESWVKKNIDKEKEWGLHHPSKTWFVIKKGDEYTPGNVTKTLLPLHIAFGVLDANDKRIVTDQNQRQQILHNLFKIYLEFSRDTDEKQDEGLSNYGIDEDYNLFYLDDDIYSWDDFSAFTHMLGVFMRSIPWFDEKNALWIARVLKETLLEVYDNDFHCLRVIHELLRGLFIPDDLKSTLDIVANELLNIKKGKKSTKTKENEVVGNKFAVLADIHANYPALEAVFEDLKSCGVEQGYILGDIVGYGPHPRECIEFIQKSNFITIQGNHDHALGHGRWETRFSRHAKISAEWTSKQINDKDREWLSNLPPVIKKPEYWCIHGAPVDPTFFNAYVYHMTYERNLDFMQEHSIPLCFHGHTHMPKVYVRGKGDVDDILEQESMSLVNAFHRLICPGSIGQPRNGNPKAQYVIWDGDTQDLIYRTVEYDTQIVLDDMLKADFPQILKDYQTRLFTAVFSG